MPIDNRLLKQRIENFKNNGKPKKEKLLFTAYYKWFIEYYTTKPRPRTQKPLAKSTLKPYNNTLRILEDFEKHLKIKFTFEHINLSFHSDFIDYLNESDFSSNYIGTQIKNIKTVMNDAFERDLHSCMDFQKSGFAKPREVINHIYLTTEEISAIKDLKYPNKTKLDIARDLFVIAAVTGLRVSDYNKLTTSNIKTYKQLKYL